MLEKKKISIKGKVVTIQHQKDGYCSEGCDGFYDLGCTAKCTFDLTEQHGRGMMPGKTCKPGTYRIEFVKIRKVKK